MLKKCFYPDWYFSDLAHIPKGFFEKNGISFLISDIDNTLVTYDDPLPTPEAEAFLKRLEEERVTLALSSNNNASRVRLFAGGAGVEAEEKAAKPLSFGTKKVMKRIGAQKNACALIGDQIFTDGLAARSCGVRFILVDPIGQDLPGAVSRVKRRLEKPIMKGYLKERAVNDPAPYNKSKKKNGG